MSDARYEWGWVWRSCRLWRSVPDVLLRFNLRTSTSARAWVAARTVLQNRAKLDELLFIGRTPRERLVYFKKHRLIPTAYPKNKNEIIRSFV